MDFQRGSVSGVRVRSLPVASRHSAQGRPGKSDGKGRKRESLRRRCLDSLGPCELPGKVLFWEGHQLDFDGRRSVRMELR